jgi:hypothetical protein
VASQPVLRTPPDGRHVWLLLLVSGIYHCLVNICILIEIIISY